MHSYDAAAAHEVETTRLLPSLTTPAARNMATYIQYHPSQVDPHAIMSTRALQESPIWLFIQDAGVLFTMLPYLPKIFLPYKATQPDDELAANGAGTWETVCQYFLIAFEIILLIITPFGILLTPGILFIPLLALACGLVWLVCLPFHGPDVCHSTMDASTTASAARHKDERWVFVNGCATNHSGLQRNIDRLAKTFGREVIGIHNKSFGLIADLLECLIQRCFAFKTYDVRIAYLNLKPYLIDATVKKVVVFGHSQGGLIISLVIDQLFAQLPTENMAKLEVYTFGSAASHFSDPSISLRTARTPAPSAHVDNFTASGPDQHVIGHIEHYANEHDMVPRWGVLHSICDVQNNLYAGSVFVRMHQSGHMFNQHYMDPMFPLPQVHAPTHLHFIDHKVSVNRELAWKRASVSAKQSDAIVRRASTGLEFGTGDRMLPENAGSSDHSPMLPSPDATSDNPVMTFSHTPSGHLVGDEMSGKTVKELSRLWRYLGGRSPAE